MEANMRRKEKRNLEGTKKHKGLHTFVGFIFGMYLAVSVYLIYNLYRWVLKYLSSLLKVVPSG